VPPVALVLPPPAAVLPPWAAPPLLAEVPLPPTWVELPPCVAPPLLWTAPPLATNGAGAGAGDVQQGSKARVERYAKMVSVLMAWCHMYQLFVANAAGKNQRTEEDLCASCAPRLEIVAIWMVRRGHVGGSGLRMVALGARQSCGWVRHAETGLAVAQQGAPTRPTANSPIGSATAPRIDRHVASFTLPDRRHN
jgi:hypothetical protein